MRTPLIALLCAALAGSLACGGSDASADDIRQVQEQQRSGATLTPDEVALIVAPPPMDTTVPSGTPRYSVGEAEQRGLVRVSVVGRDASSGPSLVVTIENLSTTPIDVYVPPGTVFVPGNGDAQRMVAWGVMGELISATDTTGYYPATSMYLPSAQQRFFILEAYCLDFELDNPAPADAFAAVAEPAIMAAQIIGEGKRLGLSVSSIQTAIWVDEDHITKKAIQAKFTASDQEVEDAFEMLKRLKRPPG